MSTAIDYSTFRHPSETAYAAGCRCDLCRLHRYRGRKAYRMRLLDGPVMVPVGPVREHTDQLLREGHNYAGIGAACGIHWTVLRKTLNFQTTSRDRAAAILAVTRDQIFTTAPDNTRVPALGMARRCRALATLGWPAERQIEYLGVAPSVVAKIASGARFGVTAGIHRAVATMYDELSMTVGPSDWVRRRSRRKGWVPPLAWDDDTIDDPDALPWTGHIEDGFVENVRELLHSSESPGAIARRLGKSLGAVEIRLRRRGHPDMAAHFSRAIQRER